MRTYIVVAILHEERYPLSCCALAIGVSLQLILCCCYVVDKLSVRKSPPRQTVYHRNGLSIVFLDRFKDGQAGQCGCHSNSSN